MKFFTPELLIRFNSEDDAEADRADAEWEEALRAYRHHLDALRDRMPADVRDLSRLDLHDAPLLDAEWSDRADDEPLPLGPQAATSRGRRDLMTLALRSNGGVVHVIYVLSGRPRTRSQRPDAGRPFAPEPVEWLYHEVDLAPDGRGFVDRVLWSDGTEMEVPFGSVLIRRIPLAGPPTNPLGTILDAVGASAAGGP
jgi:hypothetical protein